MTNERDKVIAEMRVGVTMTDPLLALAERLESRQVVDRYAMNRKIAAELRSLAQQAREREAEIAILQNNLEAEEACRENLCAHFDRLNEENAAAESALARVRGLQRYVVGTDHEDVKPYGLPSADGEWIKASDLSQALGAGGE